ncbi:DinB family protein [Paenibacillus sp. FSL H8-0034]|uniref:DinB family protein n=1 Tax=Paenibacillus sp. FSL H8-0034 TaxID=2954671 RepID=UPI0030F784E0
MSILHDKLNVPLVELVQHVVNHGTYHRGNITAMLRQLGHKGVPTDYIFYLYADQMNR